MVILARVLYFSSKHSPTFPFLTWRISHLATADTMEQSSHPILHLAFANSSRKKKGSNELKALQQELTALSESSSDEVHKITVLREGHDAVPNGYEFFVENYPYPDVNIAYLYCEPVELDKLYLNANGGKRKTPDWDTLSLEQLPKLKLVFLDGGGSLDLVERFLFAGASLVIASQYNSDSGQKDQGKIFRQHIFRSLLSGMSLEKTVENISKGVEIDTIRIPSDPYEYWDFKEEYEKKETFPWGIYLHKESETLLSEALFPLVEKQAEPSKQEELVEEKQIETPKKEEPAQAPLVAEPMAVAAPTQEPQRLRLRSKTFREVSPTRHLQDVRSHESEGILRKVAYWSQAFSPHSLSPQKEVPASLRKSKVVEPEQVPEREEEKEESVGKVIPFSQIQEKQEVETPPASEETVAMPSVAQAPIQHTNSGQGSFHKLLAMVGMGALLLTVGSSLLYNYISADAPSSALALSSAFADTDTYNVLLLPFLPDGDCNTTESLHEAAVRDHLNTFPESQELGIQVATSDGHVIGCPSSAEEAKRIGEVNNAHLVIWGKPGTGKANGQGLIKVQYVALNQHQDPLTKPNSQIGYQAFGDVYDLQEGMFAGRSEDMVYWILAVAHLKSDDYPAAINYIQQITIEDQPEFSLLMQMLAKCYQGMERFEDAIKAYDRAIFLDPHNPNIYHHRGRLHQQLNHKDLALADYTEAIRLNPKHLKAQYQRNLLLEDVQSSSRRQALSLPLTSR